jgi:hypothetical protein
MFITQYDALGNVQLVTSFEGAQPVEANLVAGSLYVTGMFMDSAKFQHITLYNNQNNDAWMFICKFDLNYNCIWAKQSQGWLRIKSFFTDGAANSYVAGCYHNTITFDNTSITASGGLNGFISKYDSLGNLKWAQNIGTNVAQYGSEEIVHLSVDSYGTVYACGNYDQDLNLCTYLPSFNNYFPKNFVASFDSNGNCLSAQNDTYYTDIVHGNMYRRGFVNTSGLYNGLFLNPGFYAMRCDASGNGLWAYQVTGGTWGTWCEINEDKNQNLLITGGITGTADFGGITATGNSEMFAAKIDCRKTRKPQRILNFSLFTQIHQMGDFRFHILLILQNLWMYR